MKKEIGEFFHTNINDLLSTFSQRNQTLIKEFLEYCKITAGDSSIKKINSKIILIADTFEQDLDKLTIDDIRAFLVILNKDKRAVSTKNDIKKTLKRFIRWKYPNWSSKFNQLTDIRLNTKQDKRNLSKQDLLTADEMQFIMNSIDSLKYKTILLFMQETGNRPEELMKAKWRDIDFDRNEIKLNSAKTGETRTIPIKETIPHLIRYKKECFFGIPRNDDFVFPSPTDPKVHLNPRTLNRYLFELEKRLKFKKHLFPYLWRHTALSKMIKTLSPKAYEMYAGHSLETGMKTYAHLDNDDLRKELYDKVFEMKELTTNDRNELNNKIEELNAKINRIPLLLAIGFGNVPEKDIIAKFGQEEYDKIHKDLKDLFSHSFNSVSQDFPILNTYPGSKPLKTAPKSLKVKQ